MPIYHRQMPIHHRRMRGNDPSVPPTECLTTLHMRKGCAQPANQACEPMGKPSVVRLQGPNRVWNESR